MALAIYDLVPSENCKRMENFTALFFGKKYNVKITVIVHFLKW